jgi:glycosyltransferase involved in cell wall biosynthesis
VTTPGAPQEALRTNDAGTTPAGALADALVSVVIIVYNGEDYVGRALASALAQTHGNLEVIVVDDASTDGSCAVVERVSDPRIRLVRRERNGGIGAARNDGIRAARGEWIAFLDCDDRWAPRKIEQQLERALTKPDAGLVYAWATVESETGEVVGEYRSRVEGDVLRELLRSNCISGSASSAMVRRDVLAAVGSFDETLQSAEDWDMWLRISAAYPVACVAEPLVLLTRRGASSSGNPRRMERNSVLVLERAFATYARKHRRQRRRARAWVHYLAAVELEHQGQYLPAAARYVRTLGWKPASLGAVVGLVRALFRSLGGLPRSTGGSAAAGAPGT